MFLIRHTHVMTALVACSFVVCAHASLRTDLAPQVKQLQILVSNSKVLQAVTISNQKHASLSQLQLHKLNTMWRKQIKAKNGPLLTEVKNNPATAVLDKVQTASTGKIHLLNVTDDKGISVAQSPMLKNYWYGYKRRWSKVMDLSAGKYYLGRPRMNKKSHQRLVDVGVPVANAQHKVIGVLMAQLQAPPKKSQAKHH